MFPKGAAAGTDQGARTLKRHPEHILEVNAELEKMGVKVLHQYAAPRSNSTRVDRSVVETLAAMPAEELIGTLKWRSRRRPVGSSAR
ncbi:MAG: hypothetical protein U1E08_01475 [Coriobacteriia bacterium]|nr:hypothetical protein [Coriobacteriia bacterium]